MFKKKNEITLNRVHDTINIREGSDVLKLTVNGDPMRIVAGLNRAQEKLKDITDETTVETVKETAVFLASVIFGQEQAGKLMEFYADDPACVISVCGQYFRERLADKISAVQKKLKV